MISNRFIVEGALSAWEKDERQYELSEHEFHKPLLQVRIIPLIGAWGLANWHSVSQPHSTYQFLQDYMRSEERVELWRRRAEKAGDMMVSLEDGMAVERYALTLLRADEGGIVPARFERHVFLDGRPDIIKGKISGVEMSLIGAIGHAAYNSTSGNELVQVDPLGAHERNPRGFLYYAGEHVTTFIQEHFPEK